MANVTFKNFVQAWKNGLIKITFYYLVDYDFLTTVLKIWTTPYNDVNMAM